MHELGIVMNVVFQVEKVAEENKVNQVKGLTMEVGEVSSIVPDLFKECFEWAKKRTKYMQECELDLVVLEAISYCRDCKQNFKTTVYAKECPHCKSVNTYLITGNEINIHDIKVV